jgi:hypothetical protein
MIARHHLSPGQYARLQFQQHAANKFTSIELEGHLCTKGQVVIKIPADKQVKAGLI